jgi:hypothetical protein
MTERVYEFSHFVVQTLVSEKWRSFDRYEDEKTAQSIARQLIPDWGIRRVRILGGYFCELKNRDAYQLVDIVEPAPSGFLHMLKSSRVVLGGSAASGALLAAVLVIYALSTPISSFADDGQSEGKVLSNSGSHFAIAPINRPVDLQARFVEVAAIPYGEVRELGSVPVRLQGPWSYACGTGTSTLIIGEQEMAGSIEGQAKTPLSIVWQSGQRYGLVQNDGSVFVVDLISADRIQKYGTLSETGRFLAEPSNAILNRCL